MKKVITFVEEGNKELIYEGQKLDEWHKTVKKLKLEGQKDFASNEDKSPIPFRALSSADKHCINELCPRTQARKDSSTTIIIITIC